MLAARSTTGTSTLQKTFSHWDTSVSQEEYLRMLIERAQEGTGTARYRESRLFWAGRMSIHLEMIRKEQIRQAALL